MLFLVAVVVLETIGYYCRYSKSLAHQTKRFGPGSLNFLEWSWTLSNTSKCSISYILKFYVEFEVYILLFATVFPGFQLWVIFWSAFVAFRWWQSPLHCKFFWFYLLLCNFCRYNLLRRKFPALSFTGSPVLSDAGFDLLNKLLTYDPEKEKLHCKLSLDT